MKKLYVELADTPSKRERGLMNRKALADDHGMLFKFPYAHNLSFWMKNTYIPLDIAFLDDQGKITQIERMYPLSTRAVTANRPCKYALEVKAGWFKENGIGLDMCLSGNALTRRRVQAQEVKKPETKRKESHLFDEEKKPDNRENEKVVDEEVEAPPEMEVEGDYPQSQYTVPVDGQEQGPNNPVQQLRDIRGKIKFADEHNLNMEIIYWTKRGHMLPPRRVQKLDEGYVIKSGPSGEMLVAFDTSPTIQGQGWSIKGMQPKSFILDNIVDLQLLDEAGKQLTDEQISQVKMQEDPAKEQFEQSLKQPQQGQLAQGQPQPQQPPMYQHLPEQKPNEKKPRNMWDKLRNIFKR